VALSHVLPCFPTLKQLSLHLVIFRHPYLTHMKSDLENFSTMNSILHFLHIHHLDFHLKKISCLHSLRRFYGVTSFSRYPLFKIIFYETEDDICFLWDLGLWILTTQPSHSYALAYCWPIHLIFLEFQNIDNNLGSPPKNFFSPFNCYNLAIHVVTLSEIFPTNYWVQNLTVGSRKTSFHIDHCPTCQ
jgi:hypothetical protein